MAFKTDPFTVPKAFDRALRTLQTQDQGPPRKPPATKPVKLGGAADDIRKAAERKLDSKLAEVRDTLEVTLRADIDRIVADMVARDLVALADVWGQGQQYVVGSAALWGE